MVWLSQGSFGTDTSYTSIQGQRYTSNGSPQGVQFQVNGYTTDVQVNPSVALASDGDFVVVWDSKGSSGTDTSGFSVQGRRFRLTAFRKVAASKSTPTMMTRGFLCGVRHRREFVVGWFSRARRDRHQRLRIQGRRISFGGSRTVHSARSILWDRQPDTSIRRYEC